MVYETILRSDLTEGVKVVKLNGNMFTGDDNANKITVIVTDNGEQASLSGAVKGYVIRPDNKTVLVNGEPASATDRVSIILPYESYVKNGQISIVVKVGTVTVGACTSNIYRTSTDDYIDPQHVIPDLAELLARIDECEEATAGANTATLAAQSVIAQIDGKVAEIDSAILAANSATYSAEVAAASAIEAISEIPETITSSVSTALAEAKASGEFDGEDGFSPVVSVTEITDGHRVSITDAEGTETFDVMDGEPGDPGHSPVLTSSKSEKVTTIYSDGVELAKISDGQDGQGGSVIDDTAGAGDTDKAWSADKLVTEFGKKYQKPSGGIPASDLASGVIPSVPVQDVQVNGTSVLSQGVANVPIASTNDFGVVKVNSSFGLQMTNNAEVIAIQMAGNSEVKGASNYYKPIVPASIHQATFYGLAKAAGDSTQSSSSNAVGTYTDEAKTAIKAMLGVTDFDVATSTEIQDIIDNYREDDDEMLIETTWYQDPNNTSVVGFLSELDASVIANYIKSGKVVIAHLPQTEESLIYGCEGDRYIVISEFAEGFTLDGHEYQPAFFVPTSLTSVEDRFPIMEQLSQLTIMDGKLFFKIYVD